MATTVVDTLGLNCPQPVLKADQSARKLFSGDILEVIGDCYTLEDDIRAWCRRASHTLLAVNVEGTCKRIQIQIR